jgi:TonB-dependent starch-binding outer membrane protein SusC
MKKKPLYPEGKGRNELSKLLLIMKLSSFLLIISFVSASASVFSQSKISVDLKNVTVKDVFADIEKKSDFKFLYRNELVDVGRQVTISANNESVETVLTKLFNQSDLTFKVFEDNLVVITSKSAQQRKVTGKIIDSQTNEPLPGVNILVEGTTIGTTSDADGKYSIDIPQENSVLVFSFVGYVPEKVQFAGQSSIDMTLIPDIQSLEEVVVIGYGTTTRKNFTGSVAKLEMKDSPLALVPHTDALDVLRGTIPGMTVSQQQGAGQSASLLVRGQKSINGGTDPMIVLDGVIFMGAMRDIDPSTIESINVLKDATSIAAYGSRAANGVIMINTKKGLQGKPLFNFQTSYGVSKVINEAEVLSPENWVKKVNLLEGLDEDADPTSWMSEFEKENYANKKTVNWQDLVERTGSIQNYALSMSGGGEKMNYYLSGAYSKTKGVLIGDDYDRKSLTSRLTTNITDWLEVGGNLNFSYNDYSGPTNYDIYQAIRLTPYGRAYRDEENKLLEKYPASEGIYRINPLWNVKSGTIDDHDIYYTTVLGGHTVVKCPWVTGLSYRLNYSYTIRNIERDYFTHEGYYVSEYTGTPDERYSADALSGYLSSANGYSARTKDLAWVWDNIINYTRSFGKHSLDLTAVYTRDSYDYNYKKITGTDFEALGNTNLGYNGLAYATTQKITSFSNTLHTNIGYLGRINYSYANKYHFTASVRRDGSSVFGEENKWGVFPSVGLGWAISEEDFMKGFDPINYLKLKLSWGRNGNQSLDPYQTLSTISLGQSGNYSYPFGNTSEASWGQRVSQLGNTNLGWEETSAFNGGFELAMFNNRISLDMDAYLSETTHQIFTRTIPVMANGITSIKATMGQVNNWGIEATLNTQNIKSDKFEWNSTLIYYINRNKLKDLYGDGKDDISNSLFLGKSLGAIYGYKPIGIVQEEDADYKSANGAVNGDVKFLDKDNSGAITSDDRCILGYTKDNFRMSLANTLKYKSFELYALFTGIFGGNGYYKTVNIYAYRTASDVAGDNNFNHGWWTSENKSNKYPRVGYTDSRYTPVQSRGFVRLQNLSLAYNFNQPWVKKMKISNLKAYMSATNLFTISGWDGGDPETGQTLGSGYTYGYPLSSVYSIGFDLVF